MSTDVIENIHVWTADQLNTKISHDHLLRTTNILYQTEVLGKGSKKIIYWKDLYQILLSVYLCQR